MEIESILHDMRTVLENTPNKSAIAKLLGIQQASLSRFAAGQTGINVEGFLKLLDYFGGAILPPGTYNPGYDYIPKVAAVAGAGASLETSGEIEGLYAFRKDFIGTHCISSKNSVLMNVTGDSMEPLICNGDTVLVDKSYTEIKDGKIYVVTLGEELRIKRVQSTLRGIILRSENTAKYADIHVEGIDLEAIKIHGRVRWVSKIL